MADAVGSLTRLPRHCLAVGIGRIERAVQPVMGVGRIHAAGVGRGQHIASGVEVPRDDAAVRTGDAGLLVEAAPDGFRVYPLPLSTACKP